MRSFLLLPLVAAGATAQQVQTRALTKPEVEYSEPFSALRAVYELKDGRVITADVRDKTLQAVDLRAGKATPVGRQGGGPQEWDIINALWGWKGDSVIANDLGQQRYLVISPDGKPVRTFSTVADGPIVVGGRQGGSDVSRGNGAGSAGGGAGGRGGDAGRGNAGGGRAVTFGPGTAPRFSGGVNGRGTDSRGRIYSQDVAIKFGDDGTISSGDSAAITRFDPATSKTDTVAYVNLAKNATSGAARGDGRGGATLQIRMGSSIPFTPADDWTVFRDGTVAILRVADYHVELVQPNGRRIVGRPVPFTPVRVGEAEKQEWREAQKSATPIVRTFGDGPRAGSVPIPNLAEEPESWPATKPPFISGGGVSAAYPAPNGDLWVVRTRAAKDKIPTIDVFNPQAQLVGRVTLPEKTRLVGFGAKGVYTIRIDEDDLQYLQRHALQWTGCTPDLKESCGR
jgi:hypothetical protein